MATKVKHTSGTKYCKDVGFSTPLPYPLTIFYSK
jgi:hypothetical protein